MAYTISQAPAAATLTLSSAAATAAFTVIAGEPGAGTQVNLNMPGSNRLNGQPFTVRSAGYISYPAGTYTSNTVQINIYASNTASFAAASGNALTSMTAIAAFTATVAAGAAVPWELEAQVSGDAVSKILGGVFQGYTGTSPNAAGTIISQARAATTNSLTTLNPAAEPPAQFTVGVVTGAGGTAGATATLTQFLLEA
jgi:hypothetical protein